MKNARRGMMDVSSLMQRTLARNRLGRGVERARAILVWPDVVGPELARMTRAKRVERGVLYVEASDSVLANFLTMQRPLFITKLRGHLDDDSVVDVRFSVGTWTPETPPPPPEPLPAPDEARARRMVKTVDGDLQGPALRAAEAVTRARLWRERQGWAPCPVCGVPSRVVPCLPCARLLRDPQILEAARQLARRPERLEALTATFGETEMDAARFLAMTDLGEQLAALALECVESGGAAEYKEFLRATADIWLSLHHRKPRSALGRSDANALPERVRRVLTAGR